MLIAIAPQLLKATRIAMLFWTFATNGAVKFHEVKSCHVPEAIDASCVSVGRAKDVGRGRVGATWRYDNQYILLVQAPEYSVIAHELGHVIIGMRWHAPEDTSLMSPTVGHRCLTQLDSDAYAKNHQGHSLELRCL